MSNSEDPDETAHYEPSHLVLRCLQKPIIIACCSERVKRCNLICSPKHGITIHTINIMHYYPLFDQLEVYYPIRPVLDHLVSSGSQELITKTIHEGNSIHVIVERQYGLQK